MMTVLKACGGKAFANAGYCMQCGHLTGTSGTCGRMVEAPPSANYMQIQCGLCADDGEYNSAIAYEVESGSIVITAYLCPEHAAHAQNARIKENFFQIAESPPMTPCRHRTLNLDMDRDPILKCTDCGATLPDTTVHVNAPQGVQE